MTPSLEAVGQKGFPTSVAQPAHRTALLLVLAGIAAMIVTAFSNRDSWSVDFSQFYVAGSLSGTGHLYDWPTVKALELEHSSTAVPYLRLPFFALAFKALSVLSYSQARILFLVIELAALAGFVLLWPFSKRPWAWVAICWSAPAAMCIAFGQDSVLFLFFATLGFWLLVSPSASKATGSSEFWAGVALSMCAAKPHIAILIPVVLVARAKWKALLGGITGGVAIVALSFWMEGSEWPARWMEQSRSPDFEHAFNRMPNLRGLLSLFGGSLGIEIVLGLLVATGVFLLSRRMPLKYGMTLALAGGLMLSHHAYVYDCPILIPALLLPFEEKYPEWLRMWAMLLVTPIPYMIILTNIELPGHLIVTGYTVALMLTMAHYQRTRTASTPAYVSGQ